MEGGGFGCGPTAVPRRPLATAEVGKLRNVELKWLWVQDVVKEGQVKLKTVQGTENVTDHLTKPRSKVEIVELLNNVGPWHPFPEPVSALH